MQRPSLAASFRYFLLKTFCWKYSQNYIPLSDSESDDYLLDSTKTVQKTFDELFNDPWFEMNLLHALQRNIWMYALEVLKIIRKRITEVSFYHDP